MSEPKLKNLYAWKSTTETFFFRKDQCYYFKNVIIKKWLIFVYQIIS